MKLLTYTAACRRECLFYKLLKLLEERGWYTLGLGAHIKSHRIQVNGFQEAALRLLVWNWCISTAKWIRGSVDHAIRFNSKLFRFILGPGEERADAAVYQKLKPGCLTRRELLQLLDDKPKPLIVVDMAQLAQHNMDELGSLRRQIAALLGVIREYLWDRHLLLTNTPPGFTAWLKPFMATHFYQHTELSTDDALDLRGYTGLRILLDPNAKEPLKPSEVLEAEVFIVGGIVDKRPRPGATTKLPVHKAVRRRIELRGSIIGLPNTLNAIVDAVLRARYLYEGDVERALYDVIPPHEARIRAYAELSKLRRETESIDMSYYLELVRWLPLRPYDYARAARLAGLEVKVWSRELVSKDQSHHWDQR